jgi:hypothetical protein
VAESAFGVDHGEIAKGLTPVQQPQKPSALQKPKTMSQTPQTPQLPQKPKGATQQPRMYSTAGVNAQKNRFNPQKSA